MTLKQMMTMRFFPAADTTWAIRLLSQAQLVGLLRLLRVLPHRQWSHSLYMSKKNKKPQDMVHPHILLLDEG